MAVSLSSNALRGALLIYLLVPTGEYNNTDCTGLPNLNCPMFVDEGAELNCQCRMPSGEEAPTWPGISKTQRLHLKNVRREDNGTVYTCKAICNGKVITINYTLQVSYGPESVNIKESHVSTTTLTCSANNVNPEPPILWTTGPCQNSQEKECSFRTDQANNDMPIKCRAVNVKRNSPTPAEGTYVPNLLQPEPDRGNTQQEICSTTGGEHIWMIVAIMSLCANAVTVTAFVTWKFCIRSDIFKRKTPDIKMDSVSSIEEQNWRAGTHSASNSFNGSCPSEEEAQEKEGTPLIEHISGSCETALSAEKQRSDQIAGWVRAGPATLPCGSVTGRASADNMTTTSSTTSTPVGETDHVSDFYQDLDNSISIPPEDNVKLEAGFPELPETDEIYHVSGGSAVHLDSEGRPQNSGSENSLKAPTAGRQSSDQIAGGARPGPATSLRGSVRDHRSPPACT